MSVTKGDIWEPLIEPARALGFEYVGSGWFRRALDTTWTHFIHVRCVGSHGPNVTPWAAIRHEPTQAFVQEVSRLPLDVASETVTLTSRFSIQTICKPRRAPTPRHAFLQQILLNPSATYGEVDALEDDLFAKTHAVLVAETCLRAVIDR